MRRNRAAKQESSKEKKAFSLAWAQETSANFAATSFAAVEEDCKSMNFPKLSKSWKGEVAMDPADRSGHGRGNARGISGSPCCEQHEELRIGSCRRLGPEPGKRGRDRIWFPNWTFL